MFKEWYLKFQLAFGAAWNVHEWLANQVNYRLNPYSCKSTVRLSMVAVLPRKWWWFYLCLPHCKQMHITHLLFRLRKQNKDFWILHDQVSKMVYSFCWFEASFATHQSLWIFSCRTCNFFNLVFSTCVNNAGFRWDSHICGQICKYND